MRAKQLVHPQRELRTLGHMASVEEAKAVQRLEDGRGALEGTGGRGGRAHELLEQRVPAALVRRLAERAAQAHQRARALEDQLDMEHGRARVASF